MDSQAIYNTIRETVLANLPGSRVLLFGSVRGVMGINLATMTCWLLPHKLLRQGKTSE